jgi:hypothetical protein
MKKSVIAAAVVMVLVSAAAWAQQGAGYGAGRGMQGREQRYDPARTETVTGEVVEVQEFASRRGVVKGAGFTLAGDGKKMIVHLGPQSYMDQQPVKIAAGDKVEVTGVRTLRRGQEVFVAGEVKKGGEVLKLRDETGRPLWAGTGQGDGKRYRKAPVGC